MDTGVTEGHTSKELVLSIINLILMNDGENFIGLLSNYLSVFFFISAVCAGSIMLYLIHIFMESQNFEGI